MQAEYLESLGGHTSTYAGNPPPPITAEDIFGPSSPPPTIDVNDGMDIDNTSFTPAEMPSPPLTTTSNYHPPLHHHQVPENDFQPDITPDDHLDPPAPYDERLENSALEEELQAFANIRYG